MTEIPRAVLSERFEEHLDGRQLIAAVFLTFTFDPEFFEQQVLPIFLDVPTSHSEAIRRVQLEDALKDVRHRVAVYYDQNGLAPDAKSARLDVSRVPVRHRTGIFHPKNVFALVEDKDPDADGHRVQSLVVACMSANLTRAGWWENVEVCHVEEIGEGEPTRLKDDLVRFLDRLMQRAGDKTADGHNSIGAIRSFLRSTVQRQVRSSGGWLHAHFFDGAKPVAEFLRESSGKVLDSLNLEVISPYFDKGPVSKPLDDLIAEFSPREVRVLLPRDDAGAALCSAELFDWVRTQPGVGWARLPNDLTRGGKADGVKARTVHAKVYRFFQSSPKREYLFVGSVNLTEPAHQRGGNLETGFLVEVDSPRRPDWWLDLDSKKATIFELRDEDEGAASTAGSRLSLRYWWNKKQAEAYWYDSDPSPPLTVLWGHEWLFVINSLPEKQWASLDAASAAALERALRSTSILRVQGDRSDPAVVLVQEEGMEQRPSLLFDLSPAEILRYWSLLTAAQRAAFLEAHAPELALTGEGADLLTNYARIVDRDSFFDRFAGIFIAFENLEHSVRSALKVQNTRSAVYRLFGQKYDSLGTLLSRMKIDDQMSSDQLIESYVTALCAKQLVQELRREEPDFFRAYRDEARSLTEQLGIAETLRNAVAAKESSMPAFLDWFEAWFLKRAKPVAEEANS